MTLTRLLCPIDFSEVSTHALEQGMILARATGARVTVLHVVHPLMPRSSMGRLTAAALPATDPATLQEPRDRVAAACRHAGGADVAVDIVVSDSDQPAHAILALAAAQSVDLVVMSTHGIGGLQHLLLGSVAEKVLRMATCPVLTVPPRAHAVAAAAFTRVLCAVDFSECSLAAVAAAAAIAPQPAARLTLLHVVEWPWHEPAVPSTEGVPPAQAQATRDYHRYLETSATERLAALAASALPGRDVVTRVRFGTPYTELLDAAREEPAELIVLGVRGRSALDVGFFGSTANQAVRRATCPVLTIRA